MGYFINSLRKVVELISRKNTFLLTIGGFFIALFIYLSSFFSGWLLEKVLFNDYYSANGLSSFIYIIALSSSIAAKSLYKGVKSVIHPLNNKFTPSSLEEARQKLSQIVGRNVCQLNSQEILRATAETASENAVDGVFAPLFWMGVGLFFWSVSPYLPGPLAFAWGFKASSTLDSMLGYKKGSLRWIGSTSARLDDILVFLPCRLVVLTLPLVSRPWIEIPYLIKNTFKDGGKDLSPNSGLSEAVFAHCTGIKMGGKNIYGNKTVFKPLIAKESPEATIEGVNMILKIGFRLEILWLLSLLIVSTQ